MVFKKTELDILYKKIDIKKLPGHIAIIMDGNGRWAEEHDFPRTKGHEQGVITVRKIVKSARKIGIPILTLYAFSSENWTRPATEVNLLMKLLYYFLKKEISLMMKKGIRLIVSGDIDKLPYEIGAILRETIKKTKHNKDLILNLALNYGGRNEILRACRLIVDDIINKKIKTPDINESVFRNYLYHPDIPDPDLVIRTSGEFRISNFLLWEIAYSEFYITKTLWPDFKERDFLEAIIDFQGRKRRFGGLVPACSA